MLDSLIIAYGSVILAVLLIDKKASDWLVAVLLLTAFVNTVLYFAQKAVELLS